MVGIHSEAAHLSPYGSPEQRRREKREERAEGVREQRQGEMRGEGSIERGERESDGDLNTLFTDLPQ